MIVSARGDSISGGSIVREVFPDRIVLSSVTGVIIKVLIESCRMLRQKRVSY